MRAQASLVILSMCQKISSAAGPQQTPDAPRLRERGESQGALSERLAKHTNRAKVIQSDTPNIDRTTEDQVYHVRKQHGKPDYTYPILCETVVVEGIIEGRKLSHTLVSLAT